MTPTRRSGLPRALGSWEVHRPALGGEVNREDFGMPAQDRD
jgi:hypothetical protein